jgi:hypothetical protein
MANLKKSPYKKGVTERYDEIIQISKLKYDNDNINLYGADDVEYFDSLKKSINTGLKTPILVYPDFTIKSGHTRVRACKKLGMTEIPAVFTLTTKSKSQYQNMMSLQMENQTRTGNLKRQYNQIVTTIEAWEKENNKIIMRRMIMEDICPAVQLSYEMFKKLEELESLRMDLFQRVIDSNGSALSVGKAHQLMKQDQKPQTTMGVSQVMEQAITKEDVTYAVNAVSNALTTLKTINLNSRDGGKISAFGNIQQNTKGGLVHEVFTNSLSHSINHTNGDSDYTVAFPPKSHNDEDIQFEAYNGGIEVKTCLIKDGNKVRFVCKNPKIGYFAFAAFSPDYDRCYVAYGMTDEKVWKKAGRAFANIDLEELAKADLDTYYGKLQVDKSQKKTKVNCYSDKLTF